MPVKELNTTGNDVYSFAVQARIAGKESAWILINRPYDYHRHLMNMMAQGPDDHGVNVIGFTACHNERDQERLLKALGLNQQDALH